MKNLNLLLVAATGLLAIGCANNNNKKKIDIEVGLENIDINNELNRAKQVFYALPSPVETAYLIQSTGVSYNVDLANSTENAVNYTTTTQKALNFGVYGADLSYASLFNQTQSTIQYMAASKKLAEELGIIEFVGDRVVASVEDNLNDRDSLMEIISDGLTNASDYLKDVGRAEVAALIVVGGWIEGLYLATSLAEFTGNNTRLIDLVIDQRYSLSILIKLLNNYKNYPNVATVYGWLIDLQNTYDRVKTVTSETKVETDSDGKTKLAANSDVFINDALFNAICQKADSIRTIIVR